MAYSLRPRRVRDLLLEEPEPEAIDGEPSDDEFDHVSEEDEECSDYGESDEGTDSDMEMEVEDATADARTLQSRARGRPTSKVRGKNGYVWHSKVPERRSDRLRGERIHEDVGPKGAASNLQSITEFWSVLFTDEIINIILEHTNNHIEAVCLKIISNGEDLQSYHHHTGAIELRALIGLLYYCGMWKQSNVDSKELWSVDNGISFYRCIMSKARFMFLCTCLRFGDRTKRNPNDKFSPIRDIWDIFIRNCKDNYEPSNFCTVDEQLLGFRGRCSFRMYIKSKPDKYGLKIITLNDAETSYLIHGIPYLGKVTLEDKTESVSEYFFREVTSSIHNTNRTVTADNWFISIPLLERMKNEPFNLPVTGTIRKNKREIPAEMKVSDPNPPHTKFVFSDSGITLLSHTPKKNKIVLVASTYSRSTNIENGKPEIIHHYNATKGGTDCFDMLCHAFTASRRTNRWPMRIFFGMLDQAAVNARILVQCQRERAGLNKRITAQDCLRELSLTLVRPELDERLLLPTLRNDLKLGILGILKKDPPPGLVANERRKLVKQQRCGVCKKGKDKKTTSLCPSCLRPMCDQHRAYICVDCTGET